MLNQYPYPESEGERSIMIGIFGNLGYLWYLWALLAIQADGNT